MIRVGIGGWTFAPWRNGVFYPEKLPQTQELSFASRAVTSIEINGTFYGAQKPESFRRWAEETPDDFVFSVKAPRAASQRSDLSSVQDSVARFVEGGVTELGAKLGPIFWQLAPTKKFAPEEIEAFFSLLPAEADGRALRHAVEVRHPSFATAAFVAMARKHKVAIVLVESSKHALISDVTADFVYVRLEGSDEAHETGYAPKAIAAWTDRLKTFEAGAAPDDLPMLDKPAPKRKRDVFAYVISGAKERNPAAARELIKRLAR